MVASLRWYYPDQVQRVRSAMATLSATVGSPSLFVDQLTRWVFRLSTTSTQQSGCWVFRAAGL